MVIPVNLYLHLKQNLNYNNYKTYWNLEHVVDQLIEGNNHM